MFVEAQPKTGRTHQIRVHARYIQHPIVSDHLYAITKPKMLGFNRFALHAFSLEFKDFEGFTQKIEAPYPQDFVSAIEKFEDVNN